MSHIRACNSNSSFIIAFTLLINIINVTGCQRGPARTSDEVAHMQRGSGGTGGPTCPTDDCGTNGVTVALPLPAFSLDDGAEAANAHRIDMETADGRQLVVDVVGGELLGRHPDNREVMLRDQQVVGAWLSFRDRRKEADTQTRIRIDRVSSVAPMIHSQNPIPVYHLSYHENGSSSQPLCPAGVVLNASREVYDHDTLTALATARQHVTMACTDHLLGKAIRMGYGSARDDESRPSRAPGRVATLRMLRADYCGTGRAFTEEGTRIYWQNQKGEIARGAPPARYADMRGDRIEAGWNQHGAMCLNTPRLTEQYTREEIEAACGRTLPLCTTEALADAEWTTWHPNAPGAQGD